MSAKGIGDQPWHADLPRSTRGATVAGIVIIAMTVMGFGVWGNTAPIAGAVVASGVFVATGQNKIIQHLEGGVIRDIMVREGDTVEPGQILVELDQTTSKAEMQRLFLRNARLTAVDSRLQAQVREEDAIHFPPELTTDSRDPEIRNIVNAQLLAFTAQRNNLNSDIAGIQDSIKALEERIAGSKIQLAGVQRQIALV